ncbi:MAG: hypothetical protein GY832_40165 [Chloroflexi bacterium]|nr:hypothetical protein [Chloroflexota bacterium]
MTGTLAPKDGGGGELFKDEAQRVLDDGSRDVDEYLLDYVGLGRRAADAGTGLLDGVVG